MTSLGCNIASKDTLVNVLLKKSIEKEEEYIHQYSQLKKLYPRCKDSSIKTELEKILTLKKESLEYMLQSKEKQHSALHKILDYLNSLEEKKVKTDTQEILQEMSLLETKISKLQNVINF
jgi:hypothetical protein